MIAAVLFTSVTICGRSTWGCMRLVCQMINQDIFEEMVFRSSEIQRVVLYSIILRSLDSFGASGRPNIITHHTRTQIGIPQDSRERASSVSGIALLGSWCILHHWFLSLLTFIRLGFVCVCVQVFLAGELAATCQPNEISQRSTNLNNTCTLFNILRLLCGALWKPARKPQTNKGLEAGLFRSWKWISWSSPPTWIARFSARGKLVPVQRWWSMEGASPAPAGVLAWVFLLKGDRWMFHESPSSEVY